ncbi:hypothetical protein LINGRAHAP2_LOCUS18605 [Linum grandiflorum]
MLVTRRS